MEASAVRGENFARSTGDGSSRRFHLTGIVSLGLLAVVAGFLLFSPAVHVNGVRIPVGRSWTVADCASALSLRTGVGDLLDVEGRVLQSGGGVRAVALWNGAETHFGAQVRSGDRLVISPAADVTEDIRDEITYTSARAQTPAGAKLSANDCPSFERGIRRVRRGALSDKLVSRDTCFASAVVYASNTAGRPKALALTFDDGPNPEWSPRIMEALREGGAHGTFFVLGQAVRALESTVDQEIAGGHEVATHSWSHKDFTKLSAASAKADLKRCLEAMASVGVETVRWFRPPYGEVDAKTTTVAREMGLGIALWDVDTRDWQRPGTSKIVSRILKGARDGRVILMHDGPARREQTVAALRQVIPELRSRGYTLVTMSEAKGLVPLFSGRVVLVLNGTEYNLEPLPSDARVEVMGEVLEAGIPPLRCGGDFLVLARDVCTALGAEVEYDSTDETVTVSSNHRRVVYRLDSLHAEADGEPVELQTPAVLYRGRGMLPLSHLKALMSLSCIYDERRHVLSIDHLAQASARVDLRPY